MKDLSLTIGWLYPNLMNIYGDKGNILALQRRCEWRKIKVNIERLNEGFNTKILKSCDILLMGGAQDKQQTVVNKDLKRIKKTLKEKIEGSTPGIYVCGGFQFLGNSYKEADGSTVEGIGIFDLYTKSPGKNAKRLIGNMIFTPDVEGLKNPIIGFENHGGRTYLGKNVKPFGTVVKGFGNNGIDKTEGAQYKLSFGTYSHGPILPKNPEFADFLIRSSLELKYNKKFVLEELDNDIEAKARIMIANRLGIEI